MEAVARLHGIAGPALVAGLLALGALAGWFAVMRREPAAWLDLARRILLGVIVAVAALGLVLALRGPGPAEWIHWLYGGLIMLALLAPALAWADDTPRSRSVALAVGSVVAAIFAWRLWGSG